MAGQMVRHRDRAAANRVKRQDRKRIAIVEVSHFFFS
jgi:hypothetical protein